MFLDIFHKILHCYILTKLIQLSKGNNILEVFSYYFFHDGI